MHIEDIFLRIFLVCVALSGTSIIARQLVREKLFRRVLRKRNFTIDRSWYSITTHGIGTSLRMQFVWGEISKEMLKDPELRNLVLVGRAASIGLYLGAAGALLALACSL